MPAAITTSAAASGTSQDGTLTAPKAFAVSLYTASHGARPGKLVRVM